MVSAIAPPVVSLLPDTVLETMAGSIVNSDVQASNVPVYAGDTFIAGAKVLRQYGLGPLPGVAMMIVLISRSGYCTITLRYDRASITDRTCSRNACWPGSTKSRPRRRRSCRTGDVRHRGIPSLLT